MRTLSSIALDALDAPPQTGHHGHALTLNSGFTEAEQFLEHLYATEKNAWEHLAKEKVLVKEGLAQGVTPEVFFAVCKSMPVVEPEPVQQHGGGSMLEYVLLAKLYGQKRVTITVHEPRWNYRLYAREAENLRGVPRGIYAVRHVAEVSKIAQGYERLFGIQVHLMLERENVTGLTKGGVRFRESSTAAETEWSVKMLERARKQYAVLFEEHTLSTHGVQRFGTEDADNMRFVDKDAMDLDDLFASFPMEEGKPQRREQRGLHGYIRAMEAHVECEGKEGYILGHPGLLLSKMEALARGECERNSGVRTKYEELFAGVHAKGMRVDVNISGATASGSTGYENGILELIAASGVPVSIGTDSHKLDDEARLFGIWSAVREKLKSAGIQEVVI